MQGLNLRNAGLLQRPYDLQQWQTWPTTSFVAKTSSVSSKQTRQEMLLCV